MGNQLFQYAAGLSLARRRGTGLLIEARKARGATGSEDPAARPLRILDLALPMRDLCGPAEERALRRRWNLARNLRLPPRWFGFHVERDYAFDPGFFSIPDGVCLHGYYQSELYFRDIAAEVRAAFALRDAELSRAIDARLAEWRDGRPLVGVHVRRGDFLTLTDRDCMTDEAFFAQAMAAFPGARFLVFSDDLAWCRAHFAGRGDVAFSPFTRVIEDFAAMQRCDHNIIAKSTFSWWAAWLNAREGRCVIAPRIATGAKPAWGGAGPDYYPAGWTII